MKKTLIIILACFNQVVSAQTNLVVNPSFEDTVSCPNGIAQINHATGWSSFSGTPDYYNSCAPFSSQASVPNNVLGYQQAATGNAYAGFVSYGSQLPNLREFVGGNLTNPLSIGVKYYVFFKVNLTINSTWSLHCSSNNLGALFSTTTYGTCNGCLPVPKTPKINNSTIITDSANWTIISGSFIADSAYKYIVIGNFFDNSNTDTLIMDGNSACTNAYYYLDDVCVSTDSLVCSGNIGVEAFNSLKDTFKVYPNPAQNNFFYEITLNNNESGFLQLHDMLGNGVSSKQLKSGLNKGEFNLDDVNDGVYLIKLKTSENIITQKIVVQH
jgi:hypothetical protein